MNSTAFPNAVFLIKSPLQYLNSLEALRHFGVKAEKSVLVLMADRKSRSQLSHLIERSHAGWGDVQWLETAPLRMRPRFLSKKSSTGSSFWRNDLFGIIKLRFLALGCHDLKYVFIGDAGNPLMRHFGSCAGAEEMVLLDDGVATLKYARWRLSGTWGEGVRSSKKVKVFFKSLFLGLRDRLPDRLTFFSVYSFDVRDGDRLVENNFTSLRDHLSAKESNSEVYFLGSPLVEAGTLTEDEFFWHLKKVADYFKGRTLRYVSHRRESPARLLKIKETFGWDTIQFDLPIEYQLAKVGPRPQEIASFFSSALENCKKIFGDLIPIISFKLNLDHFQKNGTSKGREVKAVYDRYLDLSDDAFKLLSL